MTDQKVIMFLAELTLATKIEKENHGFDWGKPVPDLWLSFCLKFLSLCWSSKVAFGQFISKSLVTIQVFEWENCVVQLNTFHNHQDYGQFNISKKACPYTIGRSAGDMKTAFHLQLAQNWKNSTKIWQNLLFVSTLPPILQFFPNEIENLEIVQCVIFENIDSLKKQRCKILVTNWQFMWRYLQVKNVYWYCHCRKQGGLRNFYIEHNLFHRSRLGRDNELQTTHIVFFKTPHHVVQVSTVSAQMALGSELVDWYP